MARFLAYTSPARGHLYPITGALLELHKCGHEVHVRTLASELSTLEQLGLRAGRVAPAIEQLPLDDWRWGTPEESLAGALATFARRSVHEMSDMERAIVDVNPDCLIIDTTAVGAAAVAEASALPWAQWIPFFQHVGVDAISPRQIARIPFTLTPAGMEVLNAPRRRLGLDPLVPTEAYPAPLYLYFTAEPFECEGLEFPSSFRLVGPGLWEPPGDAQEWPQAFDRPLVLVTASSEFQRDDALIESALRGLASEEVCLVISTVAHDPRSFEVPPNARVTRWLAHSELIEKAACVVCHGGMGITQRALAAGVPVCVVPFGRDQIEVALRVTATASGTHLPADALSPTAAREAIRQAMTMAAGAERVAEGFTRAGGPSAAAEALQSLLTTKQGSRGAHRVSPLTTPPGASPDGAQLVT